MSYDPDSVIRQVLCDASLAEKYYGVAYAFLNQAIKQGPNINRAYSIENGKVVIDVKVGEEIGRAFIITNIPLFATHPSNYHTSMYPFNPVQRGVIEAKGEKGVELTYTAPTDANKTPLEAGNCYWYGKKGELLSWRGSPGFNINTNFHNKFENITYIDPQINQPLLGEYLYTAFSPYVYNNAIIVWDAFKTKYTDGLVLGACYYKGNMIVAIRAVVQNKFYLKLFSNYDELDIGTISVPRFNTIFNWKSDGSAGIAYYDGYIYRITVGTQTVNGKTTLTATCKKTQYTEGSDIILDVVKSETSTETQDPTVFNNTKCKIGLSQLESVPLNLCDLDPACLALYQLLKEQTTEQVQTEATKATTKNKGKFIICLAYDANDNETFIYGSAEATIDQFFERRLKTKNDTMMLLVDFDGTSKGRRITNDYILFPDPVGGVKKDDSALYVGCDKKPNVVFTGITVAQLTNTAWKVTDTSCNTTGTATITNCTGNTKVQEFKVVPGLGTNPVLGNKGTKVANGNKIIVGRGTPPYTFSASGPVSISPNGTITYTNCPPNSSAAFTITVKDACDKTDTGTYYRESASFIKISDTGKQECTDRSCRDATKDNYSCIDGLLVDGVNLKYPNGSLILITTYLASKTTYTQTYYGVIRLYSPSQNCCNSSANGCLGYASAIPCLNIWNITNCISARSTEVYELKCT